MHAKQYELEELKDYVLHNNSGVLPSVLYNAVVFVSPYVLQKKEI